MTRPKDYYHVGVVEADPRDLNRNRGHEYGAGRKGEVHKDPRTKRSRTRRDKHRRALEGW